MTGAQGQYATKILRLASGNVIDHSRMYASSRQKKVMRTVLANIPNSFMVVAATLGGWAQTKVRF